MSGKSGGSALLSFGRYSGESKEAEAEAMYTVSHVIAPPYEAAKQRSNFYDGSGLLLLLSAERCCSASESRLSSSVH